MRRPLLEEKDELFPVHVAMKVADEGADLSKDLIALTQLSFWIWQQVAGRPSRGPGRLAPSLSLTIVTDVVMA
jgi:hypothetical protein